jgi:transcriptional regulator with XRE-family HTH domain
LTQEETARILGVSDRVFRRYLDRYEQGGIEQATGGLGSAVEC